jgi:hypothetical protein
MIRMLQAKNFPAIQHGHIVAKRLLKIVGEVKDWLRQTPEQI